MKSFFKIFVALIVLFSLSLFLISNESDVKMLGNNEVIPPVPDKITTTIKLYFIQDDKLSEEFRTIVTENLVFEKGIVEELIKGPRNQLLISTMPNNTNIISIETIDKICYVNLSKQYLDSNFWNGKDSSLIIWSLVNSLTDLEYIQKVQILIEGDKIKLPYSQYSFEEPFIANEELIKKEQMTPYKNVMKFLEYIRDKRYDKAYLMIDKDSIEKISFSKFQTEMEKYNKKLQPYEVTLYNTMKFSDYIIISISYNKLDEFNEDEKVLDEEWKLKVEEGEWKILLKDFIL